MKKLWIVIVIMLSLATILSAEKIGVYTLFPHAVIDTDFNAHEDIRVLSLSAQQLVNNCEYSNNLDSCIRQGITDLEKLIPTYDWKLGECDEPIPDVVNLWELQSFMESCQDAVNTRSPCLCNNFQPVRLEEATELKVIQDRVDTIIHIFVDDKEVSTHTQVVEDNELAFIEEKNGVFLIKRIEEVIFNKKSCEDEKYCALRAPGGWVTIVNYLGMVGFVNHDKVSDEAFEDLERCEFPTTEPVVEEDDNTDNYFSASKKKFCVTTESTTKIQDTITNKIITKPVQYKFALTFKRATPPAQNYWELYEEEYDDLGEYTSLRDMTEKIAEEFGLSPAFLAAFEQSESQMGSVECKQLNGDPDTPMSSLTGCGWFGDACDYVPAGCAVSEENRIICSSWETQLRCTANIFQNGYPNCDRRTPEAELRCDLCTYLLGANSNKLDLCISDVSYDDRIIGMTKGWEFYYALNGIDLSQ